MNKKFDLVGIGECLIELYGIAPYTYRQSVAGDVFNTLFYASRLGLKTGFISNFGSDDLTKNIIQVMDSEGIDRNCTSVSKEKTNGLYLIFHDEKNEPAYSFWRNDSAARQTLQMIEEKRIEEYILSSKYFHFSAIAFAILYEREILISLLQKVSGKVIITFDTNVRKGLWQDIGILKFFIEHSAQWIDILFVSKSDDENIFGTRTSVEAINSYAELAYKTVIFRQGEEDVLIKSHEGMLRVPVFKDIPIIDTTAAGDAFNAGFIASLLKGDCIENSVRTGNGCAAFVIGRQGALTEDFQIRKGRMLTTTND
jgi:2-dehydro-3-deoxygluconokinase